jgi:hypothetical protein
MLFTNLAAMVLLPRVRVRACILPRTSTETAQGFQSDRRALKCAKTAKLLKPARWLYH